MAKSTEPVASVTYKNGTLVSLLGGESVTLHTKNKQMEDDICINAYVAGSFEYDAFWDSFQLYGKRNNYPYLFAGCGWTDETYNPKYEITVTNLAEGMFRANTRITTTKVPITLDSPKEASNVFQSCTRLSVIPSIKITENVCSYSKWFAGCTALKEIHFTADSVIQADISFKDSPLLSPDTINSIISILVDRNGLAAPALTFTASRKSLPWAA